MYGANTVTLPCRANVEVMRETEPPKIFQKFPGDQINQVFYLGEGQKEQQVN